MKKFAVVLSMKDEEKSATHRQAHLDFLDEMRKLNRVLLFGRFPDGSGGLVIYEAETRAEVEAWVKEDPYITLGARDYSIHEWDMQTDHEFVRKS